jgi:hypothetical protein
MEADLDPISNQYSNIIVCVFCPNFVYADKTVNNLWGISAPHSLYLSSNQNTLYLSPLPQSGLAAGSIGLVPLAKKVGKNSIYFNGTLRNLEGVVEPLPPDILINPMVSEGDIIVGGTNGTPTRVVIGDAGQILTSDGNTVEWVDQQVGFVSPMTTSQDIIVSGIGGEPQRLSVGSEGQILKVVSGNVTWSSDAVGMINPMTTSQDLIIGSVAGAPNRLQVGSEGQILKVVSGNIAWSSDAVGMINPMTNEGDIIIGGNNGAPNRLQLGSNNQILSISAGMPSWVDKESGLQSRVTETHTTTTILSGNVETFTMPIKKLSKILKVTTDYPAWIRVYGTSAGRDADASRLITEDPASGIGIYLDASTSLSLSLILSPIPTFANMDVIPEDTAYISLKNIDIVSRQITLTVLYVQEEA